jgi:hypothetical protein
MEMMLNSLSLLDVGLSGEQHSDVLWQQGGRTDEGVCSPRSVFATPSSTRSAYVGSFTPRARRNAGGAGSGHGGGAATSLFSPPAGGFAGGGGASLPFSFSPTWVRCTAQQAAGSGAEGAADAARQQGQYLPFALLPGASGAAASGPNGSQQQQQQQQPAARATTSQGGGGSMGFSGAANMDEDCSFSTGEGSLCVYVCV